MEQHHPIMSKLRDLGGQTYRQIDRFPMESSLVGAEGSYRSSELGSGVGSSVDFSHGCQGSGVGSTE